MGRGAEEDMHAVRGRGVSLVFRTEVGSMVAVRMGGGGRFDATITGGGGAWRGTWAEGTCVVGDLVMGWVRGGEVGGG